METKDLQQEYIFPAPPLRVYECYMDEDEHADITGGEAEIEAIAGGSFSAFDGYATGIIKTIDPGRLVTMSWRADKDEWPEDHFSEITMLLEPHTEGCRLKFTQTGIPATLYNAIAEGWLEYYWEPMKEHLENSLLP